MENIKKHVSVLEILFTTYKGVKENVYFHSKTPAEQEANIQIYLREECNWVMNYVDLTCSGLGSIVDYYRKQIKYDSHSKQYSD